MLSPPLGRCERAFRVVIVFCCMSLGQCECLGQLRLSLTVSMLQLVC